MAVRDLPLRVPNLVQSVVAHLDDFHSRVVAALNRNELPYLRLVGPVDDLPVGTFDVNSDCAVRLYRDLVKLGSGSGKFGFRGTRDPGTCPRARRDVSAVAINGTASRKSIAANIRPRNFIALTFIWFVPFCLGG